MIIDKIDNIKLYSIIPERLIDFLKRNNNKFQLGKFEIDEGNLFVIGLEYNTKNAQEGLWEAHRKYLDIHLILSGEEIIHISNINEMDEANDYQDDYQLFEGKRQYELLLKKGDFLLLYPHEVHKTSILNNEVSNVKKYVFKVLIS